MNRFNLNLLNDEDLGSPTQIGQLLARNRQLLYLNSVQNSEGLVSDQPLK